MMSSYPPSIAAAKKLGGVAKDFAFFVFEWLGDKPEEWTVMKCTGAVLREAKSGPQKGKKVIEVPGTKRVAYVTESEINAESKKS